ncbi:MAG: hypothetical protein ACYC35_27310 [Pirellulales bacterium]
MRLEKITRRGGLFAVEVTQDDGTPVGTVEATAAELLDLRAFRVAMLTQLAVVFRWSEEHTVHAAESWLEEIESAIGAAGHVGTPTREANETPIHSPESTPMAQQPNTSELAATENSMAGGR